jgi:hypothetical protein
MGGMVGSGPACHGGMGDKCRQADARMAEGIAGGVPRMENPL